MDGYCSIVTFSDGELGKPYEYVKCMEEAVSPNFQTFLQEEIFQENVQPVIDDNDEDFQLANKDTKMTLDSPAAPCPPTIIKLNSECSTGLKISKCANVLNCPRRVKLNTPSTPKK
jgi:hypothetical protein